MIPHAHHMNKTGIPEFSYRTYANKRVVTPVELDF